MIPLTRPTFVFGVVWGLETKKKHNSSKTRPYIAFLIRLTNIQEFVAFWIAFSNIEYLHRKVKRDFWIAFLNRLTNIVCRCSIFVEVERIFCPEPLRSVI